jgi:aminocarboxymuconate-semialdehyde decarboxylase
VINGPTAPVIDLHAHMAPRGLLATADRGGDWFGAAYERTDVGGYLTFRGRRSGPDPERMAFSPEQRLADMDRIGTDVHVVSMTPLLFDAGMDRGPATDRAREVNEEIAGWVRTHPKRLRGLASLPLPHVDESVAALELAVGQLGLAGAEVDTHLGGQAWDDPAIDPLLDAAERLGAVLFFHPSYSLVWERIPRYHLGNTIGNPAEDALVAAALLFGGVLERHPELKVVIAHGGGPLPLGIGRLDRGWEVRPEARARIHRPPSRLLGRLHVDCITWSEPALRFLVDTLGADRVVLGSDWPYDMGLEAPAAWISSMASLSDAEKAGILGGNAARLLGGVPVG